MSRIELKHIDKFYGSNHVLRDINLTIEDGDFMTLLGPSGCGKTTTLRVVSGLEKPQNGTMTIDGLSPDDEAFLMGLKAGNPVQVDSSNSVETLEYGAEMEPPYIGIGATKKGQRDGKSYWGAIILAKCRCKVPGDDATTQEDQIDWQTQDIDFTIMRDDSAKNRWKIIPKTLFTTESAAVAFVKKALGGE